MLIPSQSILLFGILLLITLLSFAFFIWSGVYNEKDENDEYKVKFDRSWIGTWILLVMTVIFGLLSLAMLIMIIVITLRSKRCRSCKSENDVKRLETVNGAVNGALNEGVRNNNEDEILRLKMSHKDEIIKYDNQLKNYENKLIKYRDDTKLYKQSFVDFESQYDELSGIIDTNLVGKPTDDQYVEIKTFIVNSIEQGNELQQKDTEIKSLNQNLKDCNDKYSTLKSDKENLTKNVLALTNNSEKKDKKVSKLIENGQVLKKAIQSYNLNVVKTIEDNPKIVQSLANENTFINKAIIDYEKNIATLSPSRR